MSKAQNYPLGYSDQEAQRLADQGALLEGLTEDVLRRAGLGHGMQVLDIGSGVGDVSLLAARMVGSDGAVLGIDRSLSSVETARRRLAALDVKNSRPTRNSTRWSVASCCSICRTRLRYCEACRDI
jgi:cyclopropane fatty-acyl-phospholipid synthase-like methyltransferase